MSSFQPSSAAHIRVDGVSVSFAGRRVLTDVTFTVPTGARVGLIGENGSGKTTVLRLIAGRVSASAVTAGTVSVTLPGRGAARVGLLHQEPPFEPAEPMDAVLERAVAPARAAISAVTTFAAALADPSGPGGAPGDDDVAGRYASALEDADRLGAWEVDARIEATLAGLGLASARRSRTAGELSGGQRARLALAFLLLRAPDVLLLDEPTNHLDDAATDYLSDVLTRWPGPVLLASHDRVFLDETASTLVDLDPAPEPLRAAGTVGGAAASAATSDSLRPFGGVTRYTGGYTDYLAQRAAGRTRWERRFAEEQAHLRRLQAGVRESRTVGHPGRPPRTEGKAAAKFYADRNATVVARRVNDAQSRLSKLETAQIRKPPQVLEFRGLSSNGGAWRASSRSGPVIAVADASVAGRLTATSLTVSSREKWLITGANGAGKSTLLSLIAGHLVATTGSVWTAPGARIGLLTQEIDLPDPYHRGPTRSARQAYQDLVGEICAERTPLGTFGLLSPRDESRPLAALSTGQQRRLALAVALADPPDVLLLDEPTNHLSLQLVSELEASIPDYPGAVVVASHDRWLRRSWTGRHLALGAPD